MASNSSLSRSMVNTAIQYCREMHSKYYRYMLECQSVLLNTIQALALKGESELTSDDLKKVLKANLTFMRAYNMFTYWDNEKRSLYQRFGWSR